MLRLAKYLEPSLLFILIAVALLFVQANADLALPDYMSNIVNYGIQQGGIQNVVPPAIRQSQINRLVLFMSDTGKSAVLGDYVLVDKNSAQYAQYLKDYPDLVNEPVYVLKSIDPAETNKLNPIMGKAFVIMAFIQQVASDPSKAAAMEQGAGFDLSKLPPGTDIFALMAKLPLAALARSQVSSIRNLQPSAIA